ncbi:MAG: ComEC family competence protein [Desulfobacteraceae bacterium]|nr:MAG: ComEC family competence protein [Desulfobacteraceae bacterium]
MIHRPLLPILFSFTGGILVSHNILASCLSIVVPIFLTIAFSLLATLFLSRRLKTFCLLLAFFLTGILLEQGKQFPSRLMPLAIKRAKGTIEGTVLEPIRTIEAMARLTVRADVLFVEDKIIPVNDNVFVSVYDHIPQIRPGEKIRFPARLRPFKNFNNPGRYDYESAMKIKGFTCAASVSDGRRIVPMGRGRLPFPHGLIERIQRPVRDFFRKNLSTLDYAFFRALIIGERQGINKELREPFNQTGLGHVLAVSGLHIGLVAWVTFFLFKWILSRSYRLSLKTDIRRLSALLTCLPVIGYTFLAGCQVSSQRAMIMALTFLWSLILGREKEVWSTLALSALLILAIDPHAIFSISFQLSFAAVIGILWLTPPLFKKTLSPLESIQAKNPVLKGLTTYFIGLIVVSFSATIFLLPLITFYFHRISLVTIPANLTVVPVIGLWVLPFGLLCAAALPFSIEVAGIFLRLGTGGLHVMMEIIRFWADVPWASLWVITPNLFEVFMCYALMLFLFSIRRWSWVKKGLLVIAFFVLLDLGYWTYRVGFNKQLKVTFLDVGQANSALIEFFQKYRFYSTPQLSLSA